MKKPYQYERPTAHTISDHAMAHSAYRAIVAQAKEQWYQEQGYPPSTMQPRKPQGNINYHRAAITSLLTEDRRLATSRKDRASRGVLKIAADMLDTL